MGGGGGGGWKPNRKECWGCIIKLLIGKIHLWRAGGILTRGVVITREFPFLDWKCKVTFSPLNSPKTQLNLNMVHSCSFPVCLFVFNPGRLLSLHELNRCIVFVKILELGNHMSVEIYTTNEKDLSLRRFPQNRQLNNSNNACSNSWYTVTSKLYSLSC